MKDLDYEARGGGVPGAVFGDELVFGVFPRRNLQTVAYRGM
jgi:hypothetical protein